MNHCLRLFQKRKFVGIIWATRYKIGRQHIARSVVSVIGVDTEYVENVYSSLEALNLS